MDACNAVEKEVDRVVSKFTSYRDHTSHILKNLHTDIENLQKEIDQVGYGELLETQAIILSQSINQAKEMVSKLSGEHRDLHSSVSKVGKAVDKNFTTDLLCLSNENAFSGEKQKLIDDVICQHFYREGLLDVAEIFVKETGPQLPDDSGTPFFELNRILASLKERNLQPALQWAEDNRDKLKAQKSNLEFKLHRLAYIGLLSEGPHRTTEAVEYARNNLTPFVQQHEKSIQSLFGCLLYMKSGLANSPYADLLNPSQWVEICDIFAKDACALLGLAVDSPLAVCINAGCIALPVLLNIKQVMQQQQVPNMWNTKEELPIEIDLGAQCRYHSIFACPILRQQSTQNNPPMRLVCGHIISRDAVNKLTNANKLKCPYCPSEQTFDDAAYIYF